MTGFNRFRHFNKFPRIGLVTPQIWDPIGRALWTAVNDVAQENGVNLICFEGREINEPYGYASQDNIIYNLISNESVDGLIIYGGGLGQYITPDKVREFCENYNPLPIVNVSLPLDGIPSVTVNNYLGMKEAMIHLIEVHGYRRIAFISGPKDHPEAEERYKAYCDALKEFNIPFDPDIVTPGEFSKDSGENAVSILIDKKKVCFDAIAAVDDVTAIGAIEALSARKIKVPGDLAVIGFDNSEVAGSVFPPLTTVRQPIYQQGKKATEMLLSILEGKKVPMQLILPTEVVIRQSCGCLASSIVRASAAGPIEVVEKSFDEAFTECKKSVLKDILVILDDYLIDINQRLIMQLLEAFASDLKSGTSESFLLILSEVMRQLVKDDREIISCHDIISIMRRHLLVCIVHRDMVTLAEDLWQQARVLISEAAQRSIIHRQLRADEQARRLSRINQDLITAFDIGELVDVVTRKFPLLGIECCYITIFEYDDSYEKKALSDFSKIPAHSRLVLSYNNKRNRTDEVSDLKFNSSHLLPDGILPEDRSYSIIAKTLFFKDDHFGFILFELGTKLGPRDGIIFETLRVQISSALEGKQLFEKRIHAEEKLHDALDKLKKTNKKLRGLSLKDELTGLYNRRGFLTLGKQHMKVSRRKKTNFLLIFADLDGLKMINDTYGHREGDIAIINTARILKKVSRQADIIARLGGDEFTILEIDSSMENVKHIENRLMKSIDNYNAQADKPYKLAISYGIVSFKENSDLTFEELLEKADELLYEQKVLKKKNRAKKTS